MPHPPSAGAQPQEPKKKVHLEFFEGWVQWWLYLCRIIICFYIRQIRFYTNMNFYFGCHDCLIRIPGNIFMMGNYISRGIEFIVDVVICRNKLIFCNCYSNKIGNFLPSYWSVGGALGVNRKPSSRAFDRCRFQLKRINIWCIYDEVFVDNLFVY